MIHKPNSEVFRYLVDASRSESDLAWSAIPPFVSDVEEPSDPLRGRGRVGWNLWSHVRREESSGPTRIIEESQRQSRARRQWGLRAVEDIVAFECLGGHAGEV